MDPLVERIGERLSDHYGRIVSRESVPLRRARVAEVLNELHDRHDLDDAERWLLRQPHLLVAALQHTGGAPDDHDLVDAVVDYVRHDELRLCADMLVEETLGSGDPPPEIAALDLAPGDVEPGSVVDALLEHPLEIRAGRVTAAVARAVERARGSRVVPPSSPDPPKDGATMSTSDTEATDTEATGDRSPFARCRSHGYDALDCRFGIPDDAGAAAAEAAPARYGLGPARLLFYLYLFSERQPTMDAMTVLRDRLLGSQLFLTGTGDKLDDDLCDLLYLLAGWDDEPRLTAEMRASAAAAFGIPDPASTVPVNTYLGSALDRFVGLLVAWATECCGDDRPWAPPALRVAALELVGALRGAVTGRTVLTLLLWRSRYEAASKALRTEELRRWLCVDANDPDHGPGPAVRRLVPDAVFDTAVLAQEWAALSDVLDYAETLADPTRLTYRAAVDIEEKLSRAAQAAVVLRVLNGRFIPPGTAATGGAGLTACPQVERTTAG